MSTPVKTLSPQSKQVYKLLSKGGTLTAHDIAKQLNILVPAVYRVADRLVSLGMIEKVDGYPVRYKANPPQSAMNWYVKNVSDAFRKEFVPAAPAHKQPNIRLSVIRNRSGSIARTNADAVQCQGSINMIVSGLEVSDDTVLAFRKARVRGVKIRVIVQEKKETPRHRLEKWQDLGAEVRYLPNLGMRMFIFDDKIAYLNSYTSLDRENALGVRFEYPPLASQMNELFEQNWQKAEKL